MNDSVNNSVPFPPEIPLSSEAINFAQSTAKQWCRRCNTYISDDGCEWYHANWKFLKKLNMVSQPGWHLDFYLPAILKAIKSGTKQRILICGAADDGMLSVTLKAIEDYAISSLQIVMLDLCPTPLIVSRHFSRALSKRVDFLVCHTFNLPFPNSSFDVIVTDAFLTRFTKQEAISISDEWSRLLCPNGVVITTVRVRDTLEAPEFYRSSLPQRLKYSYRAVKRSLQIRVDPLRALRSSWLFSGKMTSHTFGSVGEIQEVMPGYQIDLSFSDEKEEVSKRKYARVVARKATRTFNKKGENGTMDKFRVVIIHGAYGSPKENWFPWLQEELEELGYDVIVPQFPTPEGQEINAWLEILDREVEEYGRNLIMVAHSLGPSLVLRKLEEIEEPIRATFLVSGFLGELGQPDFDPINANFFEKPFDWGKIRHNCREFFIYNSDTDPYVPLEKGKELANRLGVSLNIVHNAGHINASSGYTKFERLLEDIKALS